MTAAGIVLVKGVEPFSRNISVHFHTCFISVFKQMTGIEPACPAWEAGALTIGLHLHVVCVLLRRAIIIWWIFPRQHENFRIFFYFF